jgi:hypothetical protein
VLVAVQNQVDCFLLFHLLFLSFFVFAVAVDHMGFSVIAITNGFRSFASHNIVTKGYEQ